MEDQNWRVVEIGENSTSNSDFESSDHNSIWALDIGGLNFFLFHLFNLDCYLFI